MEWTAKKPRSAGWYWMRYPPGVISQVVKIVRYESNGRGRLFMVEPGIGASQGIPDNCEWAGPIIEPSGQTATLSWPRRC